MRASGTVLTLLLAACGASAAEQSESYFPIWGDEARARGYSIPLPYGVNLSYMNIRQDIMVDSITFSGLKLGNHPIPSDMFAIDAGHTREKSKTENLRLDMWVFPFLNVYGLVGAYPRVVCLPGLRGFGSVAVSRSGSGDRRRGSPALSERKTAGY